MNPASTDAEVPVLADPGTYLVFCVDSVDQATSLAAYLTKHGFESFAESNEVTTPVSSQAHIDTIYRLRHTWPLYWEHCDAEIFGLQILCKDSPCCGGGEESQ